MLSQVPAKTIVYLCAYTHICLDFLKGSGTRFLLLVLSCPVYTEGGEGVGEAGGEDEPDWGDADRLRQAQPDPQVSKQSEQ